MYMDWGNSIIHVELSDMVQIQTVPSTIYQLDLDVFRLALKSFEDSSDGMPFLRTHKHNTTVEVGGAILARVITIINGWTVTFVNGAYRVNLTNANSNVGDVTNVNNVSVSSANSAGLQDLNSLQAASFDGGITVNSFSSFSGTVFPVGTRQYPVNNFSDALAIATNRGLRRFNVVGNETLTSIDYSSGFVFQGDNPVASTITIEAGANVEKCEFTNIFVSGILDDNNLIRQSAVGDITHINGYIFQSAFTGTIILGGGIQATLLDCYSGIAGNANRPTIDMGGTGQSLALRGYKGGLDVINCSDATTNTTLDMVSGKIIFGPTITAGTFTVRGVGVVVDNSTGTAIINDKTVNADTDAILTIINEVKKYDTNRTLIDETAFTLTVFDDDGTTPLKVFDLKDRAGLASISEIFERDPI